LNRNCIDPFGRTALMIAIENDNIEMMGMLLRFGVALGDALLHAISEDNVEATQLLLAHDKVIPVSDFESVRSTPLHPSSVPSYIRPSIPHFILCLVRSFLSSSLSSVHSLFHLSIHIFILRSNHSTI